MPITKFANRPVLIFAIILAMHQCWRAEGADEASTGTTAPSTSVAPAPTAAPVAKVEPTKAPDNMAGQAAVAQPTVEVKTPAQPIAMEKPEEAFKYEAPPQQPGVYWDYVYRGPRPTEFNENPRFAEMVKAGQLPPVEERLPEEVKVVQGPHGIGIYGAASGLRPPEAVRATGCTGTRKTRTRSSICPTSASTRSATTAGCIRSATARASIGPTVRR